MLTIKEAQAVVLEGGRDCHHVAAMLEPMAVRKLQQRMRKDAEKHFGAVLAEKDDPRMTRVGRIMRKTALDEIPQLLNIFKGDMSWVGPRPERPEFVRVFLCDIPGSAERHQVRPGLTGVAQVYGRYYTDVGDKLKHDLYYVRHRALLFDFHLFAMSWLIASKGRWDGAAAKR